MHQQVKRISKFTEWIKTKQIAIFKARTEKRYIFVILLKLKTGHTQNDITETIISDTDFLSSKV